MDRTKPVFAAISATLLLELVHPHDWPPHAHLPEAPPYTVTVVDGGGTVVYAVGSNSRPLVSWPVE